MSWGGSQEGQVDPRPARRCVIVLASLIGLAAAPPVLAQPFGPAGHLLISEVGFDTQAESNPSSEFVEIVNPTDEAVVLNNGAGTVFYLSDEEDNGPGDNSAYWQVVSGGTFDDSASDWVAAFPVGATLPPHGVAVLTDSGDAFLAEFFGGSDEAAYDRFRGEDGEAQLFEFRDTLPFVPDAINAGTAARLSLTNNGEMVVLFVWPEGESRVYDVDMVAWIDLDKLPDKSGVAYAGGTYATDAGTAMPAPDIGASSSGSIHRTDAVERAETTSAGNGQFGHDETTEDWSEAFIVSDYSPGRFFAALDGNIADLMVHGAPLAVSAVDGSAGGGADFGADGSLTELYGVPLDADDDGTIDTLWVGIRGELFGTDPDQNGVYLLIDSVPGAGVDRLVDVDDELSDQNGPLDSHVTRMQVALDPALADGGAGIDRVAGLTGLGDLGADQRCMSGPVCGLRDVATNVADFAWLGGPGVVSIGAVDPLLVGASGTTYAAPQSVEMMLPLADLGVDVGALTGRRVALAAVVAGDPVGAAPGDPSPNMLPENVSDTFGTSPQVVEALACVAFDGDVPTLWPDLDGDGFGNPAGPSISGCLPVPGLADNDLDCDDDPAGCGTACSPDGSEICDGYDNDCDEATDDADDDIASGAPGETGATLWYPDLDGDDFGDDDGAVLACDAPVDSVTQGGDCDDDPTACGAACNDEAAEVCDGYDNDCDDGVDDADTDIATGEPAETGAQVYYTDQDGDGYGDPETATIACQAPPGTAEQSGDCDDDPTACGLACNDEAAEVCDGYDNDCDDDADDADGDIASGEPAETGALVWYVDSDRDGCGVDGSAQGFCEAPGEGWAAMGGDQSDGDGACCGNAAVETGEVCDGDDLGELTSSACELFDPKRYAAGDLVCRAGCEAYDFGGCDEVVCGDGRVEGEEACDDANGNPGDGCGACSEEPGWACGDRQPEDGVSDCLLTCGNGTRDDFEDCEDGGTAPDDGCSPSCRIEVGWTCTEDDDGTVESCEPIEGDGRVVGDEECDDGNDVADDGCNGGLIDSGWACADDGGASVCDDTCGDGVRNELEACDDGDVQDGDGCSDNCRLESGWSCTEDGDTGLLVTCDPVLGDGLVVGDEACDDANEVAGDGCTEGAVDEGFTCAYDEDEGRSACVVEPSCGDGERQDAEGCEDGGLQGGDGCSESCEPEDGWACEVDDEGVVMVCEPVAGDGLVVGDESCDDGNEAAGDGCDGSEVEDGWVCDDAEPSECSLASFCGDAAVDEGEACDDGNTRSGDGCQASCAVEQGWLCDGAEPSSCVSDGDEDGVADSNDNCLDVANPGQDDLDGDGIGDDCDPDADGDDLGNDEEIELGTDPMNPDTDGDGVRDGTDPDSFGEGAATAEGCSCSSPGPATPIGLALVALVAFAGVRKRTRWVRRG